jgi:hypothetical protein
MAEGFIFSENMHSGGTEVIYKQILLDFSQEYRQATQV